MQSRVTNGARDDIRYPSVQILVIMLFIRKTRAVMGIIGADPAYHRLLGFLWFVDMTSIRQHVCIGIMWKKKISGGFPLILRMFDIDDLDSTSISSRSRDHSSQGRLRRPHVHIQGPYIILHQLTSGKTPAKIYMDGNLVLVHHLNILGSKMCNFLVGGRT